MKDKIIRVNNLIKREVNDILLKDVEFPGNVLVTITRVETSPDIEESKIYISVFPPKNIDRILDVLKKIVYGLQKNLDKRLRMRPIPRIRFVKEKTIEQASRVEEILEKIGLEKEE